MRSKKAEHPCPARSYISAGRLPRCWKSISRHEPPGLTSIETVGSGISDSPGDVAKEAAKLREEQDGDIVVHGSARLVQTLIEHDLVDELRLMVFPVVLGSGKRLFGETSNKKPLRLVDSKTVGDGVAILTYEPAKP